MSSCQHVDVVPVETVTPDGVVTTVAHLCLTCNQQLPANWGCPDCWWETYETRRLCDPHPATTTLCTRPCPTHQEDHP